MTHVTDAAAHVVRTVVDIAAPPARVFEALTDPRELAAWWAPGEARVLDCAADVRPGGSWRVRTLGPDGAERAAGGEYGRVDAPRRLEHSWRATGDECSSVVRYDLHPIDVDGAEGTRLTVTHSSPTACAAQGRVARAVVALGRRIRRPATFQPVWCGVHAPRPHRVAWARASARRATSTRTA